MHLHTFHLLLYVKKCRFFFVMALRFYADRGYDRAPGRAAEKTFDNEDRKVNIFVSAYLQNRLLLSCLQ